jgi:very-short-patch-repair endonuclease
VTEERTCECGTTFQVLFSPERKVYVKKTCSKACAARRKFTQESSEKKSNSMKQRLAQDVELRHRFLLSRVDNRHSSLKAERALAELLRSRGFKRHKQVSIDGVMFDVDIVSDDGKVWVESDGEWHFRQVHAGHDFETMQFRD